MSIPQPWTWERPAPTQWVCPLPAATWTCGNCGDTYTQSGGIDAKEAVQKFAAEHLCADAACLPPSPESEG